MAEVKVIEAVAKKVAELGGQLVEDQVVDTLVDREVTKRSEALVKVIDLLQQAEKELGKVRPDLKAYDAKGGVVSENWSKKQLDEKSKVQKKVEKLTQAINKALDKKDFGDVYNLASGKLKPDDDAEDVKSEGGSED